MNGAMVNGTLFTAWPPPFAVDFPTALPYTGPREMELAFHLQAASASALQTAYAALVRAMTPYAPPFQGDTSRLTVTLPDSSTRQIECYCTGVSDMELKGPTNAEVIISFMAPHPFFHQEWGAAGASTAWATGTNPKTISNTGDVPFWPVIKVMGAAGSTIVGLHLTNTTTGKVWSTSQTIAIGATKYITVYMDRAQADYYDDATNTDIISTMDTDAQFWPMRLGDNALQWSSTSGTPSAITVYHMWYYLGI